MSKITYSQLLKDVEMTNFNLVKQGFDFVLTASRDGALKDYTYYLRMVKDANSVAAAGNNIIANGSIREIKSSLTSINLMCKHDLRIKRTFKDDMEVKQKVLEMLQNKA